MPRAHGASRRPLNARQRRFVEEYRLDGNGAGAAIRAGYYINNAAHTASALLRRPDVQALLAELVAAEDARAEAAIADEGDPALAELRRLAFANILDFTSRKYDGGLLIDWTRMSRAHSAAIRELVIEETRTRHGSRQILRIRMAD